MRLVGAFQSNPLSHRKPCNRTCVVPLPSNALTLKPTMSVSRTQAANRQGRLRRMRLGGDQSWGAAEP